MMNVLMHICLLICGTIFLTKLSRIVIVESKYMQNSKAFKKYCQIIVQRDYSNLKTLKVCMNVLIFWLHSLCKILSYFLIFAHQFDLGHDQFYKCFRQLKNAGSEWIFQVLQQSQQWGSQHLNTHVIHGVYKSSVIYHY